MSSIAPDRGGRNSLADNRHVFGHCDLTWRGDSLLLGQRQLAHLVPDTRHRGMWRISINGRLTDMVNKSRARDAALSLALGLLNRNAEETRSGDPSVEKNAAMGKGVNGRPTRPRHDF
jgi:hypothetical protein